MSEKCEDSQKKSLDTQRKIPPIIVKPSTNEPGTIEIIIKAEDKKKKS